MTTIPDILYALIEREGGFVNHPADRGGPTKYGITQATLSRWLGRPASIDDVRNLEESDAYAIYRDLYVIDPHFNAIRNNALFTVVVDAGVLKGTGWAARRLQEIVRVPAGRHAVCIKVDGIFGPKSIAAVNGYPDQLELLSTFIAYYARKLAGIVAADPSQLPFLKGWINRATGFLLGPPYSKGSRQ